MGGNQGRLRDVKLSYSRISTRRYYLRGGMPGASRDTVTREREERMPRNQMSKEGNERESKPVQDSIMYVVA